MTNEKAIWDFLLTALGNPYGAAGMMGNLYAESGLNPTNLQNSFEKKLGMTDASYTAAVDAGIYEGFAGDGAGYGLAQWTYWSRKDALLQYARLRGRSIGDLETQLEYLWKELQGYSGVLAVLKGARSVREASDKVLVSYERPADQSDSARAKRAAYGQKYFDTYAGGEKKMAAKVQIGGASIDENGKARGGKAGNQNGKELRRQDYYVHSKGWRVFRILDPKAREAFALALEAAIANRNIGYDQGERLTLYSEAKKVSFVLADVKTPCECDCSALIRVCLAAAGIFVGNFTTATESGTLLGSGKIAEMVGDEYTKRSDRLLRGDILCTKTQGHTVGVLTSGLLAGDDDTPRSADASPADPIEVGSIRQVVNGKTWYLRKKPSRFAALVRDGSDNPVIVQRGESVRSYGEMDGFVGVKLLMRGYKGYISKKAF